MTMTSILSYPKFFLLGICRAGLLSRQKLSLLRIRFLDFVSLPLYVVFLFFPSSACVLIQSCTLPSHARTQTSTQHSSVHSLAHASRAAGLLAPSIGGEGWGGGRGRCPVRASGWRWTWLLSTESRHSYTMGPFTHMSDSVADWGRGNIEDGAPSLVGGPWKLWYGSA